MPKIDIKNVRGETVGSLDLDDQVFGIEPRESVVHQAVVAQLANQRRGTHDTKTRSEVAGGGRKPWRQKGTGRARQGSTRAPHWRGGGVTFGPHPRSYEQAIPRKMRRLAMRSALSAKVADSALLVVDDLALPSHRTRDLVTVLGALGLAEGALIVLDERNDAVTRASGNLPGVHAVTPPGLNLLDVLHYPNVVMTPGSVRVLTDTLLRKRGGAPAANGGGA